MREKRKEGEKRGGGTDEERRGRERGVEKRH